MPGAQGYKERNQIINAVMQRVEGELIIRNSNWLKDKIERRSRKSKSVTSKGVIMEVAHVYIHISISLSIYILSFFTFGNLYTNVNSVNINTILYPEVASRIRVMCMYGNMRKRT